MLNKYNMKVKVKIEKEMNAKYLWLSAGVRYWEDGTVNEIEDINGNLTPCRKGDNWCPHIDIDTGTIFNWSKGVEAEIHFKVCDQCSFTITDEENETVFIQKDNYVPKILCPKDRGFGDYIIMDITSDGVINKWNKNDLLEIFETED